MRLTVWFLALVVSSTAFASAPRAQGPARSPGDGEARRQLRVAVVNTPDVLLDGLIDIFEARTRYDVVLQITEGVYDLARRGMADLVIAHYGHPGTEAFVSEGLGRWPRMVFANQAVLVGPTSDPAGVRGLTDAAEAMRRIASRGGEFLINNASTEKYLADVLTLAGGAAPAARWQVDLGLRDEPAIQAAARRGAYTLWGLVPFVRLLQQQRDLGLAPLVVADPIFQRVMVSIVVNGSRIAGVDADGAIAFERFLIEPATQAHIRSFRHHGLPAQTWWPAGRNNAGTELMSSGN